MVSAVDTRHTWQKIGLVHQGRFAQSPLSAERPHDERMSNTLLTSVNVSRLVCRRLRVLAFSEALIAAISLMAMVLSLSAAARPGCGVASCRSRRSLRLLPCAAWIIGLFGIVRRGHAICDDHSMFASEVGGWLTTHPAPP